MRFLDFVIEKLLEGEVLLMAYNVIGQMSRVYLVISPDWSMKMPRPKPSVAVHWNTASVKVTDCSVGRLPRVSH
jgi:hypothetical protein